MIARYHAIAGSDLAAVRRARPGRTAWQTTGVPSPRALAAYQRKRDFARTPEPAGAPPKPERDGGARRFVVQRHRARRLHYDLRFEIDGVLVSWAVPRGPTLDPDVKRIAVHVEDHPIEYLEFEGIIPAGEYGGGDVIVWDLGTWEPHETDDPAAAVAAGELHADVAGQKLRGRLVLVRTGGDRYGSGTRGSGGRTRRGAGEARGRDDSGGHGGSDRDQWLLLHKRDEFAVVGWDPEEHPRSVLSGRTNDEVKAHPQRMWRGDLPPSQASVAIGNPGSAGSRSAIDGARDTAVAYLPAPSPDELGALGALGAAGGSWEVFGRRLRVTNLDKVMFPARNGSQPVTKRDFIAYAASIAPVVLPYLAGRPLNMHRFPGGAQAGGFWHKQLPEHAPDWLPRWERPDAEHGKATTYLVVDEPAALVWAANFGALEWHAWTSRTDQPDLPSYALIDIDAGSQTSWDDILVLARLHRTALEHLGVRAQPKVTGHTGIQIWVPITRGPTFEQTRKWVEQLSKTIGAIVPELVSWQWDVRARGGRARLDYTQNVHNKTLVAPYSPRPAAGAPVSAPIDWDELDDPSLRPDGITIATVADRLAERGDPFRSVLDTGQVLPPIQ
jgi:bifunctional non-homologous end joining protein LigD